MTALDDNTMEFIRKLERLSEYAGKEADDDFRDLIGEVQDEFGVMKGAAVRDGHAIDARLMVQDVLDLGAEIGKDFPQAQRGCEVFASVYFAEKVGTADLN